jgi:hypothetical protein
VQSQRECIYDRNKDRRRGRKQALTDLYGKSEAFDSLLAALRASDDKSAEALLDRIKSGTPLDELIQYARDVQKDWPEGDPMLRDEANPSATLGRAAVMSIAVLCDTPLIRVSASPWTNATNDDDFVSHLLSVFFTWHHGCYPCLEQDLFIRDMQTMNLSAQFCSPFLVNTILLVACVSLLAVAELANPVAAIFRPSIRLCSLD